MWTDEEFEKLEQSEHTLTLEEIALMLLLLGETKRNIEKEVIEFYNQYGTDGKVTYAEARKYVSNKDRRRRLVVLLLFLLDEFNRLNKSLEVKFQDMESKIFKKEFDFFNIDIPKDFVLIAWGLDTLTWKDRLANDVDLWGKSIGNDLKRNILREDTLDVVLDGINKRFMSIENVLKTLGISESSAETSIARQEIFNRLGIAKYRYYTKADERTCDVCGAMYGLTFPIESYEIGVTAPPLHPRCRCYTIPI